MEELLRARDPTTPEEELRRLLQASTTSPREVPARTLREALAGNPNAPADVLQTLLAEHPDAVLGNPALSLLLLERPDFWASLPFPTRRSVLEKAHLNEEHLRMFFPEARGLQCYEEALLRPCSDLRPRRRMARFREKARSSTSTSTNHPGWTAF